MSQEKTTHKLLRTITKADEGEWSCPLVEKAHLRDHRVVQLNCRRIYRKLVEF